jgi:hypothetical protein
LGTVLDYTTQERRRRNHQGLIGEQRATGFIFRVVVRTERLPFDRNPLFSPFHCLQLTTVDDLGTSVGTDRAAAASECLDLLDDAVGLLVRNFTKDNVLAIEPGSLSRGDEELRAVATTRSVQVQVPLKNIDESQDTTYVLGPALAMERIPSLSCLRMKFSSANFSP